MSRRRDAGEGEGGFADAMDGVQRLRERGRRRAPPAGAVRRPQRAPAQAPAFALDRTPEHWSGRALDVSRRTLARLRRGEFDPDCEIDLHGARAAQARRALAQGIEGARQRGVRCALVIHGRGLHSEAGPVLRDALIAWLQEPPLAHAVMAFCTAPASRGGAGATLVLLRRVR